MANNTKRQQRGPTLKAQQMQEQAIEALAKELPVSVDKVRELYEAEHARLLEHARIKTYVPVIAARLVRTALHQSTSNRVQ